MPREDSHQEVPFDSLADRGQYRAFQRAYGKENQAMLTLIVLTVAWSYAAHVYGHGTVFVWFSRTAMAVLVCFVLFHALKHLHGSFEQLVIKCGPKALLRTPAGKVPAKKKPKRPKNKLPERPGAPTPEPTPVADPSKQPKDLKQPKPKKPPQHSKPAPEAPNASKPDAHLAAESALAEAQTEAKLAHERLEQAMQAEALALAQSALAVPKPGSEQPPAAASVALPAPRSRQPQRVNSGDLGGVKRVNSGDSGDLSPDSKPSYVPPHLREGYKRKGQVPNMQPRSKPAGRQRGRRGSGKQKEEASEPSEPVPEPKGKKEQPKCDQVLQASSFACLADE